MPAPLPTSLPTPCLVISDAHVGVAPPASEQALRALLLHARTAARSVIINGDLFEFWFGWREVIPRRGARVLASLAALTEAGVPVLFLGGNHDCWGGEVLEAEAGLTYHLGAWRGGIGGWRVGIEHGDGLREREDAPYRRLRAVLRHPWAIAAFRAVLHPDWATALALRSSHTSRNWKPGDRGEGLRRVALERLAADPTLDLCVLGHSHVPALERGASGGVYANPGAWLDEPRVLWIDDREVSLMRWTDGGLTVEAALGRR